MKNDLQNGHVVRVTTPAGGIASDEGLIVGSIFGIAAYSAAEGDPLELVTTGLFQLPKASAAVLTLGARLAWDNTARQVNTPAAGRFPIGVIGVAVEAAGSGATSVAIASRCGCIGWQRRRRDSPNRYSMSVTLHRVEAPVGHPLPLHHFQFCPATHAGSYWRFRLLADAPQSLSPAALAKETCHYQLAQVLRS
jgi:predicted RecA/RadA family phage recombinase